jgi:hypothetical protein
LIKFRKYLHIWQVAFFVFILQLELFLIRSVSDLVPGTSNWVSKANEIMKFEVPSDNFYGPGSALLLVPFVALGISTYLANHLYLALATIAYWKICTLIPSKSGRLLALSALSINFYLLWLVDSSQDTVFEFFLLSWAIYFLISKRIGFFAIFGFVLCLTRAGYWVFYLGTSIYLFSQVYLKTKKINLKKLFAVYFLLASSIFNLYSYGSPSPALEGGLTAYFSYTKYHYLALPKMDMDVFLSGPQGAFSPNFGPQVNENITPAEKNSIFQDAAISSALDNKKETVLGWMQKYDSYFFDAQKIPHLPGRYVLNQAEMLIKIEDERLSWTLVLGNLLYMFYRSVLIVSGFTALGLYLGSRSFNMGDSIKNIRLGVLIFPYIFGAIPGIVIYTETRFKIVSEMLLVPLIIEIWVRAIKRRSSKGMNSID